jgi:signal transduction histidine kinase
MTHEIRTPLNSIVGFSDILPTIEDAEEKKQLIRIIHDNCDMLLRLISDILEASDIDLRPMEISPTDIDFAKAFDDICQSLEQRMQNRDVQFIKDNPYTTFHTRLDKGRVRQVITNFFTNAVKYTQQGHIKVGYKASQRESDHADGLLIYCEDTGAGIAKEDQAHIFDRFVKLNEFVQGTGLGLNICKSIAERCGGNIGVDSDGKGKGSTFWIWIPCRV